MLNRRFQLLLDKDMWNRVTKGAKSEKISAGEYIRRAVTEAIERNKELISNRPSTPFNRLFKPRG